MMNLPGAMPSGIEQISGSDMHITLYNNSGTWQVKDHTTASPAFANITGNAEYIVPFPPKGVNLTYDNSGYQPQAVLAYSKHRVGIKFNGIVEVLNTGMIHPVKMSRVFLTDTVATYIHIHG